MTRRSWMLAVAMLSLTVGGVWAGLALANAKATKGGDCCPPGEVCPDCLSLVAAKQSDECCNSCCKNVDKCPSACAECGCTTSDKSAAAKTAAKTSCCCDDPTCPPGCTPECAAECLPAAKVAEIKATKDCPPCPFCP